MNYMIFDENEIIRAMTHDWTVAYAFIEYLVSLGLKPQLKVFGSE